MGFTFLQEMRQDIRDANRRIDDLSHRIDELRHRMDQRFSRQTATMLGIAGAIIAAVKL